MKTPDLELRPYRPGDEVGILETFNLVFRDVCGPDYVDRDLATWQWVYERNPAGYRIFVAEAEDGRIAGHYGGVPYLADSPFGELTIVHAVDSYTHPEFRAGLKRPGLFVRMAETWFDDVRTRGDQMVYGYPVKTAARIGQRYLGYTPLRIIEYLVCPASTMVDAVAADVRVEVVDQYPESIDGVAEAQRSGGAGRQDLMIRRDSRYLNWRFAADPAASYERLLAFRGDQPVGALVLRPQAELVPNSCAFADWLVMDEDVDAIRALAAAGLERCREHRRERVFAVLPEHSAVTRVLRAVGFIGDPSSNYLERHLMHRSFDERLPTDWLADHWRYTIGDSDLI